MGFRETVEILRETVEQRNLSTISGIPSNILENYSN
jgi:hypothetical protein